MNKKIITPLLIVLVIALGISGYFFGFRQGKIAIKEEIQAKEAAYQKSGDAAKQVALKFLNDMKFKDYEDAYNATLCSETMSKIINKQDLINLNLIAQSSSYIIKDFVVVDTIIDVDNAKVRFSQINSSPLLAKEIELPGQISLKLKDTKWCVSGN